MESFKKHWLIVCLVIIVLGLGFYWKDVRSANIIKKCSLSSLDRIKDGSGDREDYEYFYKRCQRENGLDIPFSASWKL